MIHIIEFDEQYAADFRRLNLEWLEKYDLLESHDLMVLDEPRKNVLDRGGFIYLASDSPSGTIVGSAALLHEHDNVYELAKMSVDPAFRGQGISKLLIEQCLRKAKEIGAGKLILWSNSQLQTAIRLYTQYGFQQVPVVDSPFVTADVKMELLTP
ncbi:MAG TPA: GNAT family N-acetyltransferase [Puia sp.]|nr:GNAT family N-acetyltransferase [Puia sp.]